MQQIIILYLVYHMSTTNHESTNSWELWWLSLNFLYIPYKYDLTNSFSQKQFRIGCWYICDEQDIICENADP